MKTGRTLLRICVYVGSVVACSSPEVFIFWPSISISSGIKRFLPDKMLILVVSSGQRPVLPDVFLVRCPFIGILISSAAVARVPSKGSLSLILPSRAGPLRIPLTGPRTAMPFDRHTVPGLLLHVDIERRLEVPAETRGHP